MKPPFLIWPASMGMVSEAPASVFSIAYCSESDMVACWVGGYGDKIPRFGYDDQG
eukprot:CAMPEP_0113592988 /NCGR_PEP_ID=MMETSP0015_2-20120614/38163_1 /TAXON_ID=2838 /ORGANISM="Odontella" /LENGTH=54 /DNA_ID=CAMNT_0000499607 /DNA_START=7 /DNA_END=171 /DNA_ORIENTATION=+ /assembly_acc=CAM_ASM_000160